MSATDLRTNDPAADLGPHEQLLLKHFRAAVTVQQCQIEDSCIEPDAPLWKIYLALIAISLATWAVIIAGFVEVYPIVKGFINAISS